MNVKYAAPAQDPTGYGHASRAFIASLFLSQVNTTVQLVSQFPNITDYGWEGALCTSLRDRTIDYKIKIIHTTPDIYQDYREKGKYNIGHLFWETDRLPVGWAEHCNKLDEIWTSSTHMVDLFKASGVTVPIYAFAQPMDTAPADQKKEKFIIRRHSGYMFYSIFQWIDRKNPHDLVSAYWKAFQGRDDVSLLIKTFRHDYSPEQTALIKQDVMRWKGEQKQSHYPKIFICTKLLSRADTMMIHQTGDCYVTADRGEGWGRTIHEALLLGKPVIGTARGGIYEHLSDLHTYRIPSTYVPAEPDSFAKFYTQEQNWAQVDREKLIAGMKYIFANQQKATAKGLLGSEYVKQKFNYWTIGSQMLKRLEEIQKTL